MIPVLRPYQEQALEAERRHRAEHQEETRLAIVLATGLGKGTIIAERAVSFAEQVAPRAVSVGNADHFRDVARTLESMPRQRVLILAHTDEIVTDLAARCALRADGNFTVGIVKAEQDECTADIVVASVQTLANPSRRQRIEDVGLVIVDECHHSIARSYEAILRHFGCIHDVTGIDRTEPEYVSGAVPALGFTATLERGDGASLGGIWQDVCFTRDISWGVRHGYLVQPIGHRLEIDMGGGHPLSTDAVDQDWQLIEALAPEKIVEKWIELAANLCEECVSAVQCLPPSDDPSVPSWCPNAECGVNQGARPTVAFMPLVRSARALADAFLTAGVSATWISGALPDEETRLRVKQFKAGDFTVMVNAMILTEGFDHPPTSCVIVGRPTKSRPLFVQMAGRGLRPVPGIPVEEQDCILITVADATTDLCSVADLSDRPIDRKAQGALTAMEDAFDIGAGLEDPTHFWTGQVDAKEFDPLVTRSSKVWRTTEHGTPYLPISKDQEYVFIVGTSVWAREINDPLIGQFKTGRLHKDLPDLELAMQVAEDEAQERGGDIGRLLADKNRAWRKERPSEQLTARALQLGLGREVERIMAARAGGKAGKVSDLVSKVIATRTLEPMVERIKEATK